MDCTSILDREEVLAVLKDLRRRARRAPNSRMNLVIFRLSCCCGLRCCEITGLQVGDVICGGSRPVVRIRKDNTKGRAGKRKGRLVPLWWDAGTLADLSNWLEYCKALGRKNTDRFLFGQNPRTFGQDLEESLIAKRWRSAIRSLGADRVRQLSIHKGRHSFASHSLHCGRSLAGVRDALGHSSIAVTSIYAHTIEAEGVKDLFAPEPKKPRQKKEVA